MMGIVDCPESGIDARITALEVRVGELEDMLEAAVTAALDKIDGTSFNTAFATPPDPQSVPVAVAVRGQVCPVHTDTAPGQCMHYPSKETE